jgi:hypothetical protein
VAARLRLASALYSEWLGARTNYNPWRYVRTIWICRTCMAERVRVAPVTAHLPWPQREVA